MALKVNRHTSKYCGVDCVLASINLTFCTIYNLHLIQIIWWKRWLWL